MDFILYESGTTRSARCRWTLLEAGIDFKSISEPKLIGSESAAICTFIADQFPDTGLIANPGTWARAQHDQWVSFALTEMEAWLWNTAVNSYVLPPDKRIDLGFQQNTEMFKRSAQALNDSMSHKKYLIENQFSVTDIIVGWTVNWGRRQGLLDGLDGLQSYLNRLLARPHCALAKD